MSRTKSKARNFAGLSVGSGTGDMVQLDSNGRLPAVDGSLLTGIEGVPSGIIAMWSGVISSIPTGWVLCDGTNSTPDLRERFIVGSGTDSGGTYNVGDTGGSDSITLAEANLPSHTHGSGNFAAASAGSHNHNGSTSNTGNHSHNSIQRRSTSSTNNTGTSVHYGNFPRVNAGIASVTTGYTNNTGAHSHNLSISSAGAHTHSISGSTGATGSGTAVNIVPRYYALAFIMKT